MLGYFFSLLFPSLLFLEMFLGLFGLLCERVVYRRRRHAVMVRRTMPVRRDGRLCRSGASCWHCPVRSCGPAGIVRWVVLGRLVVRRAWAVGSCERLLYVLFFLHNIFLAEPVFAAKPLVEQGESRKSRAPKIRKREMKTMVNVRNANRSKPEQIGCEPEENYSKW